MCLAEFNVGMLLRRLEFAICPCSRTTRSRTLRPRRRIRKLRRAGRRRNPRARTWQADRALVAGRSQDWRIGQQGTLTYVWGEQGSGPARLPIQLGLRLRRRLPGARHRCRARAALYRQAGHDAAPGRDQPGRDARCPGCRHHRRRRMAQAGRLILPSNINTLTLPAYAPELNAQLKIL